MSIILFLIIFLVVVIAHEFGHFIVAKKNGIRVVEFFIGMGPSLVSFQKGETKYSLKLFPVGGACMFEGEDGLEKEKGGISERAFPNAPVWARVATIFAGPLFNFLVAFVMAVILVSVCGITTPEVLSVSEDGRALQAGMQVGDVITKINGKSVHLGGEVTLISQLNTKGETLTITYERNGQEGTAVINPSYDEATAPCRGCMNGKICKVYFWVLYIKKVRSCL